MVGWMLAGFGYQPDVTQTELALTGIALMLTIIPGVFHYLVGALMQRYRITDEAYRTLLAGLLVTQQAQQKAQQQAEETVADQPSSVKMTVVPGVSS